MECPEACVYGDSPVRVGECEWVRVRGCVCARVNHMESPEACVYRDSPVRVGECEWVCARESEPHGSPEACVYVWASPVRVGECV